MKSLTKADESYCGPYGHHYGAAMADAAPHSCAELVAARAIIAEQTIQIRALDEQIVVLTRQHEEDEAQKASLRRRVGQLARQVYGTTNEKHKADPAVVKGLVHPEDEDASTSTSDSADPDAATTTDDASTSTGSAADAETDADAATPADDTTSNASAGPVDAGAAAPGEQPAKSPPRTGRKPGGRTSLPVWMPERQVVLDLPEAERLGPDGRPLPVIDQRTSWRLDYVEPHYERVLVIQLIYGNPFRNDGRIITPPLASIVSKGLPTDRLVAHIVVDKYDLHLPLYRQEICAERLGLPISRSTLMNWCAHAARALAPIHVAIGASILQQPVLGLDDTYLPVLEPGLGRCHQGRLWGYLAGEEFFCEYRATREGKWPAAFLADYHGTVLGDAYSGHKGLFVADDRTPAGCISHARRKFVEADRLGEHIAKKALDHFTALYEIERSVAGCPPEQVLAARKATSVSIMDKLETLLRGWVAVERPSSATWVAANYTIKIYDQLREFTRDGRVPIDNNALERCWRAVGIGRHNWLFAGSDRGGGWAATHISISQSCRLVGLDPFVYMQGVFAELNKGRKDYANLRPAAWAAQHQVVAEPA